MGLDQQARHWPTPRCNDPEKRGNVDATDPRNGLPGAAALWATPMANVSTFNPRPVDHGIQLANQVATWSTPRASDGEKGGPNMSFGAGGTPLPTQAAHWPTPATRDYKGANSTEHVTTNGTGRKHMDQLPNFVEHCFSPPDPTTPDGAKSSTDRRVLNPRFVEWLMGWPIGWTNLDCAETGSSAWLQRARGWLLTLSTPQPDSRQGMLL